MHITHTHAKKLLLLTFRLLTDNGILMVSADVQIFEEGHGDLCKQSGIVSPAEHTRLSISYLRRSVGHA